MSCVYHPEVQDVGTCVSCKQPLCADCARRVQEAVYCEICLAEKVRNAEARASGASPAEGATLGGESPGAAFVLGLIPGVGAIYNAEYFKAAAHIVIFALLISISNNVFGPGSVLFGMLSFGFYFYMPFEAYYTARKRLLLRQGVRLETPFDRVNESFNDIADKDWWGGIALVAVGTLFLLDNFGVIRLNEVLRLWPAALIVLGVWLLKRFHGREA